MKVLTYLAGRYKMSWKYDLVDAFEDWRPENFYELPKDQQLEIYQKWEQGFLENQVAQAEAREDR